MKVKEGKTARVAACGKFLWFGDSDIVCSVVWKKALDSAESSQVTYSTRECKSFNFIVTHSFFFRIFVSKSKK
jgi:hypothetical protein